MLNFIKEWKNRKRVHYTNERNQCAICPECGGGGFSAIYGLFFVYISCMLCKFKWIELNIEEPIKID